MVSTEPGNVHAVRQNVMPPEKQTVGLRVAGKQLIHHYHGTLMVRSDKAENIDGVSTDR